MSMIVRLKCDVCGAETATTLCRDRAVRKALKPWAEGWLRILFSQHRGYEDVCPTCAQNATVFTAHALRQRAKAAGIRRPLPSR